MTAGTEVAPDTTWATTEKLSEATADVAIGNTKRKLRVTDLLSKPTRTLEIPFGDTGSVIKVKAISSKAYDDLVAEHPPTPAQIKAASAAGSGRPNVNEDTFPPALVAACSLEPIISLEQASDIFGSDAWSQGELLDWYYRVNRLCQSGIDIPFTTSG